MAFEFLASFGELNKLLTQENYSVPSIANESILFRSVPCTPAVNHQNFYLWLLLPGVTLSLCLACSQQRKNLCAGYFNGRPGLIIPHNTLSRSNRFSYAAAFGAITFLCSSIILESRYAIDYTGPPYLKVFIALASMFIYGVGYFPLFASLAVNSVVGYGVGTFYAWMLAAVSYYNTFYCPGISMVEYVLLFIRGFPELFCFLYLCFSLPFRFVRALRLRHYFGSNVDHMTTEDLHRWIKKSYNGLHVRALLRRKPRVLVEYDSIKEQIVNFISFLPSKLIYKRLPGFRYSSRMLAVMSVSLIILYRMTVESLIFSIPVFQYYGILLNGAYDEIESLRLHGIAKDLGVYGAIDTSLYLLTVLFAILLTAISLSFIVGVIMILHSLASYRRNLLSLYKGNPRHLTPRDEKSNESLLVGSMRFAGYQVAYVTWGFVVQFLLLFVIFIIITVIVILFKWNYGEWILDKFHNIWPVLATSVTVNILQLVLAKLLFLQENHSGNVLAIDNRRWFFILVYFMFFYNIFTGFISCLLRIGKAIILGGLILPRLDLSTLPRKFQWFDSGFDAYCGFMHVEATHTNPVAIIFIEILKAAVFNKRRLKFKPEIIVAGENHDGGSRKEGNPSRARSRWYLIYTLLNNPSLILHRKHALHLTRKADIFLEDRVEIDTTNIHQLEETRL